ncbi:MAG TPA: response regulator transcription factor [Kofleriaceae bacterium]|nr:response regulator transcription factor [Kofleriaceae bacterium]
MIRVALAEEQGIVRWALHEALAKAPGIEVVGDAGTVEETIAMIRDAKPDVLVIDTTLRDHTGFDVLAQIRQLETGPVVVLAPHTEPGYAARAIAAGAHGYVSKSESPERLLEAIRAVSRGEQFLPHNVAEMVAMGGHPASSLTARELQVMEMLARGMTNREIAHDLDISIKTVDTHRGHVLKKLGLRNNSELTRFAVKHGYVSA